MAIPSRLSLMERAGRHRAAYLDPMEHYRQKQEDALMGGARDAFIGGERRSREAARGANDVLRGSGFGQFFDSLADAEAGAAFDGKDFRVSMDRPRGLSRLSMLEQGGRGGVRTQPPSGITVHGPRVDPDRYVPPYMPETWKRDGVSPLAGIAKPLEGEIDTQQLLGQIRDRRVGNERRDLAEAAETEASLDFVPSAVRRRGEASAVRELIERIKAQAETDRARTAAEATRDAARIRGQAQIDAARERRTVDPFDYMQEGADLLGQERPKDETSARIYDLLLGEIERGLQSRPGGSTAPGTLNAPSGRIGGPGSGGGNQGTGTYIDGFEQAVTYLMQQGNLSRAQAEALARKAKPVTR